MKIAIDALNLYSGGSITHLNNFLLHFDLNNKNDSVYVILYKNLPVKIFKNNRIKYVYINNNKKSIFNRLIWQLFNSNRLYKKLKIDYLFVPGGIYIGNFKPFIVMCRNMLLFEKNQIDLYDSKITRLKIQFKAYIQLFTFYRSTKLIFISNYAKKYLESKYNWISKKNSFVINHGISKLFYNVWTKPKKSNVFKIVYSSAFEPYKNHIKLIDAFDIIIKNTKYKFELILIGGKSDHKYFKDVNNKLDILDKEKINIKIYENITHKKIVKILSKSNFFIFPSSCENMPNALLEAQLSGIPILSSNLGPMPEFLTDSDIKFNPMNINDIVSSINYAITNYNKIKINNISKIYKKYNWQKTYLKTIKLFK